MVEEEEARARAVRGKRVLLWYGALLLVLVLLAVLLLVVK